MGSQKYENVGGYQSLLIMNDPIIFTRTHPPGLRATDKDWLCLLCQKSSQQCTPAAILAKQ
jgi:hypothetical protein